MCSCMCFYICLCLLVLMCNIVAVFQDMLQNSILRLHSGVKQEISSCCLGWWQWLMQISGRVHEIIHSRYQCPDKVWVICQLRSWHWYREWTISCCCLSPQQLEARRTTVTTLVPLTLLHTHDIANSTFSGTSWFWGIELRFGCEAWSQIRVELGVQAAKVLISMNQPWTAKAILCVGTFSMQISQFVFLFLRCLMR